MKVKTAIIILSFCVLFIKINSQLFDALIKKPNLRLNIPVSINKAIKDNQPINVPESLFQNFYQKNEQRLPNKINNKVNHQERISESLFGNIEKPLSQITKERYIPKNHEGIFERHIDRRGIDDEIQIFLEKSKKISIKIRNNEKTLGNLNSRIEELVEKNNNIKKEIKKYKSLKTEKESLESKVTSVVDMYQVEVNEIKSTIINKSAFVEKIIKDKESNFENVHK